MLLFHVLSHFDRSIVLNLSPLLLQGRCASGSWWGTSEKNCDWQWKQCAVPGKYALFGSLGAFGFLVICCAFVCVCCLCNPCRSKKSTQKGVSKYNSFSASINDEEEGLLAASKHPKTDAKRNELEQKYQRRKWAEEN
jgi:hypothetical protein